MCIISGESYPPIDRPPLSKEFLLGDINREEFYINTPEFYIEHKIKLSLDNPATSVNFDFRQITLKNGTTVGYENLMIATGSNVNTLDIPGNTLLGVHYLRYLEDAIKIREDAEQFTNAVVLGGMFMGTEVAAQLNALDLDVTLIFPENYILSQFSTPEMADFFTQYFEEKNITLITGARPRKFMGRARVDRIILESGTELKADMVVAGIGVSPATHLFEGSSLQLEEGAVVVNEFGETNIENVYAAGDVAKFLDHYFNKLRHSEHWENAIEMGEHIAKVMIGRKEPYKFLPFIFSDIFELSYELYGDPSEADDYVIRGNMEKADFSTWWFKGERLVAAFILGSRPNEEAEFAREWIENAATPDIKQLEDNKILLEDLV